MAGLLLGLAGGGGQSQAAPAGPKLTVTEQAANGLMEVRYGAQPLLVYAYASNQFKPYVKELYTLKGDNLLRDAPPDHLHHHGLMYAIRVNGVNFWEERQEPGFEKPVTRARAVVRKSLKGHPQVVIRQRLHWLSSADHALADTATRALLVEDRTLSLTVDEAAQEVALEWRASFTAGPGAPKAALAGATYHGLGMRLPQPWDHAAQHQNSEGAPYSAEQRGDVTPAKWSAVSHPLNGHEVMVALFGHPANRGDTRFFTMLDAFAYLAVTQNLDQAPLEYNRGDRFDLRYLVTVYPAKQSVEFLRRRYDQWLGAPATIPK